MFLHEHEVSFSASRVVRNVVDEWRSTSMTLSQFLDIAETDESSVFRVLSFHCIYAGGCQVVVLLGCSGYEVASFPKRRPTTPLLQSLRPVHQSCITTTWRLSSFKHFLELPLLHRRTSTTSSSHFRYFITATPSLCIDRQSHLSFFCYAISLVLEDGSRLPVMS